MANPTVGYGFRPVALIDSSGVPNFGAYTGFINPASAQKIFYGDVLAVLAGGYFAPAAFVGGGGPIGGVADSLFMWNSITARMRLRQNFWTGVAGDVQPGGTVEMRANCFSNVVFQCRTTGLSGNPVTQAQVGYGINFNAGAGGNPLNGLSSYMADDSQMNATPGSLPFKVYGIVGNPESDPTSINNEIQVVFNNLTIP
jgi:hypothetical protein